MMKTASSSSSWAETPAMVSRMGMTPGMTPTASWGATPTPSTAAQQLRVPSTPLEIKRERLKTEFDQRNRSYSDEELDALLPPTGTQRIHPNCLELVFS
jgi:hypothetical protein